MTPACSFRSIPPVPKRLESTAMKEIQNGLRRNLVLIPAVILLVLLLPMRIRFVSLPTVEAQAPHRKLIPPKPAPVSLKEVPQPFLVGETLNYRVSWAAFSNAASVQVSVPEKRDLSGWPALHFRASVHTVSPVRALFAIDDEFDSYTDRVTLESHQYETYLNELGRKQAQVLHLLPSGQTLRTSGPVVIVLPGTRDPVGAFYSLRSADWHRTPELRAPIYDGREVYNMTAKIEAAGEAVVVPAGSFSASRISVHLVQNGKEVPIKFIIWLADTAQRTPVQIQAELPFGSVRAGLISAP
jgi:hypothetical protein